MATKEYADELVVLAVSLELAVRITIIPFTPPSALGQWAAATYAPVNAADDAARTIYLGNNDVHYVYLSTSQPTLLTT